MVEDTGRETRLRSNSVLRSNKGRSTNYRPWMLLTAVFGLALSLTLAQAQSLQAREYYEAGLVLKRAQKLEAAVEKFQAALKIAPQYAEAYYGLAWSYVSLGQEAAAVEAFRWVIRLAPQTEAAIESARAIERIRLRRPELVVPPPEPQTFLLALSLIREGNVDLYLADAEGVIKRRLTTHPAADTQPDFPPDGRRLVFVSERSGNRDLWLINTDGQGLKQLTDHPAADYSPTWSPRGSEIVFVSERSGRPELWALDLESRAITPLHQASSRDLGPRWSPRGERLAFVSDRDGPEKLFLWDPATRQVRKLLANTLAEHHPVWAPQGEYLYFTWNLEGHSQVCRVRLAGEGLEAVRPTPDNDRLWGISPDGVWLLLSSDRSGRPQLYLRERQGERSKLVGQGNAEVVSATVSPSLPESVGLR